MSKTVLVVDDDTLIRKTLVEAFADAGLVVIEAADGKAGLEQALDSHPDLVVCDVRMPEMDGLTMVEKLRTDAWGKNAPVIMLSTDESTTTINQALASGVTVYLSKTALTPDAIAQQIVDGLK